MKEDKDKTIIDFFQTAANAEIPDNGFSSRVMERIEAADNKRIVIMSRIWSAVCAAIAIIFILHSGFIQYIPAAMHDGAQQITHFTWSYLTVMLYDIQSFYARLSKDLIYVLLIPQAIAISIATLLITNKRILNKL